MSVSDEERFSLTFDVKKKQNSRSFSCLIKRMHQFKNEALRKAGLNMSVSEE